MAITTTPLGFQKPDGNEPFRQGNDVISANAQKAQDLIAADKARLALLEQSAGFPGDPIELADDVVHVLVTDPGSATAAALNTTFGPASEAMQDAFALKPGPVTAAAGTHRYLSLEAEDLRDLSELWVGDSIGNEQLEHIFLLLQARASLNPSRSYIYHLIDPRTGATWTTPVTLQTGTGVGNAGGPFVTHVWNFAVSGMNASYAQGSRYPVLLATNPDLVVLLHGKNEGTTAGGSTDAHWRGQYLAFTETIKQDLPFADLVCVLQIPNRDNTDMAKKNRIYAQIAGLRSNRPPPALPVGHQEAGRHAHSVHEGRRHPPHNLCGRSITKWLAAHGSA
ncbi:SGNH/GDSL hydrolase family protein [Arthrobacter sp. D3-18]